MKTKVDCIVVRFNGDCDCKKGEHALMTISSLVESGVPLCEECETEYVLDNEVEVRA